MIASLCRHLNDNEHRWPCSTERSWFANGVALGIDCTGLEIGVIP
jgi:hypothetical protein